jgi:hypothetical protein
VVEEKIEKVEEQIGENEKEQKNAKSEEERARLQKKEEQLRKKEEQLRKEKEQLREEKLLLMRRQQPEQGAPSCDVCVCVRVCGRVIALRPSVAALFCCPSAWLFLCASHVVFKLKRSSLAACTGTAAAGAATGALGSGVCVCVCVCPSALL